MKIKSIIEFLEALAPPVYQESYDNARLLVGDKDTEVTGVLVALDATEAVIDEAIDKRYNLVVVHHPIIFKGLKSLTGKNYVERVVIKAIKNDIALYAIHTNLDNVIEGVNGKIAEKLGLETPEILVPKAGTLRKLFTFSPISHSDKVRNALFEAGGGDINGNDLLSYTSVGAGTANGTGNAEAKLEIIFPVHKEKEIIKALLKTHPAASVPYDIITLNNENQAVGSGMIGSLPKAQEAKDFLKSLKKTMEVNTIRHTAILKKKIKTVAFCGGAGSFLLPQAIAAGADVFITADLKYHEFFDADDKILLVDIGHFESEQFTIELLQEQISNNFSNFAVSKSKVDTNPIKYL